MVYLLQSLLLPFLCCADLAVSFPLNNTRKWNGWRNVKYIFVFGDSYSTTGFRSTGVEPSAGNPMGNPSYPGLTSSNGPNWVDFLTTKYNHSLVLTYNIARGGATVDSGLVAPTSGSALSISEQVKEIYLPTYASKPDNAPWSDCDSLFAFFIGVNDVGNSYKLHKPKINALVFEEYKGLIDEVYQSGARNFMFLNVPPIQRAPKTALAPNASAQGLVEKESTAIADWNMRLVNMASNLTSTYSDATAFVFDTYGLFNNALDNPKAYEQTKMLKNTTNFCASYEDGTSKPDTFNRNCIYPVDEYFWLNSLHPTGAIHNAMAFQLAQMMSKPVYPSLLQLIAGGRFMWS
ncbi:hypothetical protein NA57DRAFT_75260 [Rhizodiscina lignyota]|uniref:Carbohydrate esterase family 16 protein n=1 Tax=Rhizodiscina lignyota TaxID=1504668 RepID=A0A9P4IDT6_9PEZI|nr:hypothetical protein NA57DRAFT_75260 [Rhizodiscina lignyota]